MLCKTLSAFSREGRNAIARAKLAVHPGEFHFEAVRSITFPSVVRTAREFGV
jgi:hypothetical protein